MINKKQIQAILCVGKAINEITLSKIAKRTNTTHGHCVTVVNKLEELGVVRTYRKGRCRFVFLTTKGRDVLKAVEKIWEVFYEDNQSSDSEKAGQ